MTSDKPKRPRVKREQKPPFSPRPKGYQFTPRVDLQHERLVGRVVIAWAKLEAAMHDTFWLFLGLDIQDGRVVSVRFDAHALRIALRKLAETCIPEEGKRLDFLDRLTKVEDRRVDRNFIVHGNWGMFGDPNNPMRGLVPLAMSHKPDAPDPTEVVSETFPTGRMYSIIDDIVAATKFFADFLIEHDPSRGKETVEHYSSRPTRE
jgi:hypothetical protein